MTNPTTTTPHTPHILIADDEESIRFLLKEIMRREGYHVTEAADGDQAIALTRQHLFDLVILDIRMPGTNGIEALKQIRRIHPHIVVLMITAHGNHELAIEAIQHGAYDFFNKPFELDEMRVTVRRALEKQALTTQLQNLQTTLHHPTAFHRIIGQSQPMQQMFQTLQRLINNDITVLITGESGTGKELVAQAIHYQSHRRKKPYITVNCAAIPENLLESQLFGHERGSFTGAHTTHIGHFETANDGTLFLDEIGELPHTLQAKLLRALQEQEITRIGASKPIKINTRIITATNRDLQQEIQNKNFREDLYYRLNVLPVHIPPLRARRTDIPLLINHFLSQHNPRLGRNILGIDPTALAHLTHYNWPGNVRELENILQRAIVLTDTTTLTLQDFPPHIQQVRPPADAPSGTSATTTHSPHHHTQHPPHAQDTPTAPLTPTPPAIPLPPDYFTDFTTPLPQKIEQITDTIEQQLITHALHATNHHRQATADLLQISRKSLHNKMTKHNMLNPNDSESDL